MRASGNCVSASPSSSLVVWWGVVCAWCCACVYSKDFKPQTHTHRAGPGTPRNSKNGSVAPSVCQSIQWIIQSIDNKTNLSFQTFSYIEVLKYCFTLGVYFLVRSYCCLVKFNSEHLPIISAQWHWSLSDFFSNADNGKGTVRVRRSLSFGCYFDLFWFWWMKIVNVIEL